MKKRKLEMTYDLVYNAIDLFEKEITTIHRDCINQHDQLKGEFESERIKSILDEEIKPIIDKYNEIENGHYGH